MKLGGAFPPTAPVSLAKSATERGRELRDRRRSQGLIELKVWVSPNDQDKFKAQAQKSVERHLRSWTRDQAKANGQKTLF